MNKVRDVVTPLTNAAIIVNVQLECLAKDESSRNIARAVNKLDGAVNETSYLFHLRKTIISYSQYCCSVSM